ncbi:MAG TPA: SDR family oxidoreductase [Solirubrobacteraceae bacterium]|jgi:gluconate 5-dehydrogenase|nr:SDR family oxidoreductase [Solirubrobacteraceae bacterium]
MTDDVKRNELESVRVLVTGGTSGLGKAMAVALAKAGARVAITSRDRTRAETAAAEIDAVAIEMDVRDARSVYAGVERVYETLGGLEVLVNNAGIGMRTVNPRFMTEPLPFWEVTPEGFRDVLETKMTGSFLVARAVAPRMLAAGSGRIVVISMNEQTMTRRGFVPYGPSGAGVEALARVMAADLDGSPVTVNILLPGGATATGMIPDHVTPDPKAGLLDPSIVGPPIVWLCSPQAHGVHDQRIVATEFKR